MTIDGFYAKSYEKKQIYEVVMIIVDDVHVGPLGAHGEGHVSRHLFLSKTTLPSIIVITQTRIIMEESSYLAQTSLAKKQNFEPAHLGDDVDEHDVGGHDHAHTCQYMVPTQ